MLNIIGKIFKNKVFMVIAILIIITFPNTLYKQSDKDTTIVATSIGIEKKDDKYSVVILAVIPKGESDVNSNLEIFEAEGDTISSALDSITLDIGRKIGLAHCDCIVFTEEIMKENLTQILDYFTRTANLSTNPTLIATPNSAKELLEAVKSSNNLLDLSLKNIISSQEDRTLLKNITLDRFYRAYFSPNSTFTIPILTTDKGDEQTSQSGESGGNLPDEKGGSGGSSNGSSSEKQQEQAKIKNDNEIAIIRDGTMIGKLSQDEQFIYNLLTKPSSYQKFTLENIDDENFKNSTVVFQEADKFIIPKYKFIDGKPIVEYNIWLSVMIDEVKSTDNNSYSSISGTQNFLTDTIKNEFNKLIEDKLIKTISLMQENNYDILNLYSKFSAYRYQKFYKYLQTLENQTDYMQDISIDISVKLNYVI